MRKERKQITWQTTGPRVNSFTQRPSEEPGEGPGAFGTWPKRSATVHETAWGREHLGGMGVQKWEPWPDLFMPSCPVHGRPLGALSNPAWRPHTSLQAGDSPPTTPKLHPQILHPTFQVQKELRKERELEGILFCLWTKTISVTNY